ncbi:hypothetical protein QR680_009890 [Steinernema hermaphroditum]|uniref:Uncharacterized protein n=1 Tax=Steinernema hermaphroditum TaxID=289476 RepID=A0AA39ILZ9_9BILA|nr:hypothetical protein QR680_009890 [Steinernema hermaphroditum]
MQKLKDEKKPRRFRKTGNTPTYRDCLLNSKRTEEVKKPDRKTNDAKNKLVNSKTNVPTTALKEALIEKIQKEKQITCSDLSLFCVQTLGRPLSKDFVKEVFGVKEATMTKALEKALAAIATIEKTAPGKYTIRLHRTTAHWRNKRQTAGVRKPRNAKRQLPTTQRPPPDPKKVWKLKFKKRLENESSRSGETIKLPTKKKLRALIRNHAGMSGAALCAYWQKKYAHKNKITRLVKKSKTENIKTFFESIDAFNVEDLPNGDCFLTVKEIDDVEDEIKVMQTSLPTREAILAFIEQKGRIKLSDLMAYWQKNYANTYSLANVNLVFGTKATKIHDCFKKCDAFSVEKQGNYLLISISKKEGKESEKKINIKEVLISKIRQEGHITYNSLSTHCLKTCGQSLSLDLLKRIFEVQGPNVAKALEEALSGIAVVKKGKNSQISIQSITRKTPHSIKNDLLEQIKTNGPMKFSALSSFCSKRYGFTLNSKTITRICPDIPTKLIGDRMDRILKYSFDGLVSAKPFNNYSDYMLALVPRKVAKSPVESPSSSAAQLILEAHNRTTDVSA